MALEWTTAKVVDIQQAAPAIRRFFLQFSELEKFDFEPGQFVTLDLPIHEQKNKRWRSYSIASAPNGTNIIELVIVLLEGGAGTTYLFNHVNVGSELIVRGPQGKFTLPEVIDTDIYFICTGTGIAPFRAMSHFIHNHKIQHQNIHLIFGCRKMEDCLYREELTALAKSENNFFYHPCLSREPEVPAGMYKGYVHQVYDKIAKENKRPSRFYLCGWKSMVDEAKQRIVDLGYDRKDIHLELYG